MQRLTTEFKGKVELIRLPDAVIEHMRKLSVQVMQEESDRSPPAEEDRRLVREVRRADRRTGARSRAPTTASSPEHPAGACPAERGRRLSLRPEGRDDGMRELARRIDALQDRFGRGVSWMMLAMVVVVFGDVLSRYLFRTTYVFVQELEWYLFGASYLLAAGYTLLFDEHVRVDIVYSKLSPRKKAWFDLVLLLVFFFPSCLLVIYTAWPFVRNSWAVWEGSPDPGGIPGAVGAQVDDHRGLRLPAAPGPLRDHQAASTGRWAGRSARRVVREVH